MLADEEIIHDVLSVILKDLLELVDVVVLVCHDEVRHRQDLWVVLVRLGFLRVERVDIRLHQPAKIRRRQSTLTNVECRVEVVNARNCWR